MQFRHQLAIKQKAILMNESIFLKDAEIGSFYLIKKDNVISKCINDTGVWEPDELKAFEKLIQQDDVVFDIGANLGHHSVYFSRLVGEEGKVYCFEPQNIIYKTLVANLLINDCKNAFAYHMGLGNKNQFLHMLPLDYEVENNFGALGFSYPCQSEQGELVEVVTLDHFVEKFQIEKIDFLKLDVQTFELFVFQGAHNILSKYRPKIFFEVSPFWMNEINNYDYRDMYSLLKKYNYELFDLDMKSPAREEIINSEEELKKFENVEWYAVAIPGETA